jgi:hypothetical protein
MVRSTRLNFAITLDHIVDMQTDQGDATCIAAIEVTHSNGNGTMVFPEIATRLYGSGTYYFYRAVRVHRHGLFHMLRIDTDE